MRQPDGGRIIRCWSGQKVANGSWLAFQWTLRNASINCIQQSEKEKKADLNPNSKFIENDVSYRLARPVGHFNRRQNPVGPINTAGLLDGSARSWLSSRGAQIEKTPDYQREQGVRKLAKWLADGFTSPEPKLQEVEMCQSGLHWPDRTSKLLNNILHLCNAC